MFGQVVLPNRLFAALPCSIKRACRLRSVPPKYDLAHKSHITRYMASFVAHFEPIRMGQIANLFSLPRPHILVSSGLDLQNIFSRLVPGGKMTLICNLLYLM